MKKLQAEEIVFQGNREARFRDELFICFSYGFMWYLIGFCTMENVKIKAVFWILTLLKAYYYIKRRRSEIKVP